MPEIKEAEFCSVIMDTTQEIRAVESSDTAQKDENDNPLGFNVTEGFFPEYHRSKTILDLIQSKGLSAETDPKHGAQRCEHAFHSISLNLVLNDDCQHFSVL